MVSKFLSEHTGTIFNCENNGNKVETTLLVVTPPTGESGVEEEDELDYHIPKDADSDDPKAFNEVARCHTGYSFPRARVAWVDKNGESVNDCDNENYFDTSGCNADKDDSEVLEAVDVPLSFKLKNGESQSFTCRVTYEIVENGKKVTKTQEYRFPESGEISYGEMAVPIETDDGAFRGDPDAGEGDVTEDTTEDEHSEEGEEEPVEKGELHNALLGTATGIIILVIIIFLIWFIRKKSQNEDQEYTAGNKAEVSP